MKKPKAPKIHAWDWSWPFSAHEMSFGWCIEGASGLVIMDRLEGWEAALIVYALNATYKPAPKRRKK